MYWYLHMYCVIRKYVHVHLYVNVRIYVHVHVYVHVYEHVHGHGHESIYERYQIFVYGEVLTYLGGEECRAQFISDLKSILYTVYKYMHMKNSGYIYVHIFYIYI